jgi:hypothetical protein
MMDKHLIIRDGLQHENCKHRNEYTVNLDLYDRSLGGKDGKEENVMAPEVHQGGGDVNPFQPQSRGMRQYR